VGELRVEAWRVHDTGLVALPSRFRRLGGLVRHLQGTGPEWPARVELAVVGGELHVSADAGPVGTWTLGDVTLTRLPGGPPQSFVLELPGASHLLAAAAGSATESFLAALAGPAGPTADS
jgi:hypothetical protein